MSRAQGEGMRVAYIMSRFPYLTETFIVRDMAGLIEHGARVDIFSLLEPKHDVATKASLDLMPLSSYSSPWSRHAIRSQLWFLRRRPRRYLRAFAEVIRQTWREPRVAARGIWLFPVCVHIAYEAEVRGVDHVHANFVWLEALAAGVVRDLTGIPYSIRPHAFGLFSRDRRDVRAQLRKADGIVTISDYHRTYAAEIAGIPPQEVDVVHLGIDTDFYSPSDEPIENDQLKILSIGRNQEKKGHEYLLEACSLLAERRVPFDCTIVTNPGAKAQWVDSGLLESLGIADHVDVIGSLDEHQILEHYHSSDVFALACVVAANGDRDGMPNVLLESMACGLPVVTTPVAGIPELVIDGDNGLLVSPRDSTALAAALESLADSGLRSRLGRAARAAVEAGFDTHKTTRELLQFMERVTSARARPEGTGGL